MAIDLKGDMDAVFLGPEFSEVITYNNVSIPAQVFRGNVQSLRNGIGQGPVLSKFKMEIEVSKTHVPVVVVRDDTVVISHHGRAADTLRVQSIIYEDIGMFRLGLA